MTLSAQHLGPTENLGQTAEERAYYALSRRVYAIFAYFYDVVVFPVRGLRREVARAAALRSDMRVLDVATGTGEQAFAFAETAGEVVGIDLSEQMLRIARRKNRSSNVSFQQADATRLPFEDASFDVSCVSFAFHEMPDSIRKRALAEMLRVTKPEGAIIVVDYALPKKPISRWLAYHFIKLYEADEYARFVKSDLKSLFEPAGLVISDQHPALGGSVAITIGRRNR